jgi:hypothetical protein
MVVSAHKILEMVIRRDHDLAMVRDMAKSKQRALQDLEMKGCAKSKVAWL